MAIDHTPFIHPEDSAALEKLKAVPLLDTVVRQYMMSPVESMLRDMNMASRIRVGPNQMPELHAVLTDVCRKLDMPVPRFFLEMNPDPDAYTGGVNEPFIILTTSAVELLPPDELVAVIAHQCGHILCNHQLYHTLFDVMQMGRGIFSVLRVGGGHDDVEMGVGLLGARKRSFGGPCRGPRRGRRGRRRTGDTAAFGCRGGRACKSGCGSARPSGGGVQGVGGEHEGRGAHAGGCGPRPGTALSGGAGDGTGQVAVEREVRTRRGGQAGARRRAIWLAGKTECQGAGGRSDCQGPCAVEVGARGGF